MLKRFAITAAAAMALAAPLSGVASAQQYGHDNRGQHDDNNRNDHGRDNNRNDNNRNGNNRNDNNRPRWDDRQYNGYTYNGRWYYGTPSAQIQRGNWTPGYHSWRRGDRLSQYQRSHYSRVDYRREHLRAPPRGYNYVRSDRGEILLVAVATGVILSILASH